MTINKYSKLYISRLHTKDERMTMHSGRRPDGQKSKSLYNQLLADGLAFPPSGTCRRPFNTKICLIGAFISELLEFLDFPFYKPGECDISVI